MKKQQEHKLEFDPNAVNLNSRYIKHKQGDFSRMSEERLMELPAGHGLTIGDLATYEEQLRQGTEQYVYLNEAESRTFELPRKMLLVEATDFYLLELEAMLYDKETGQKISEPKWVKYHKRQFAHMMESNGFLGYRVLILHDPNKPFKIIPDEELTKATAAPPANNETGLGNERLGPSDNNGAAGAKPEQPVQSGGKRSKTQT